MAKIPPLLSAVWHPGVYIESPLCSEHSSHTGSQGRTSGSALGSSPRPLQRLLLRPGGMVHTPHSSPTHTPPPGEEWDGLGGSRLTGEPVEPGREVSWLF